MNLKKHKIFAVCALTAFAVTLAHGEGIPIELAETKCGSIDEVSEMDEFTFSGNAGQTVIILVAEVPGTGEPGFWPEVCLYTPSLSKVLCARGSNSVRIRHHLTECGTWRIIVRDSEGSNTGEYCLSLIRNPGLTTHKSDLNGGPIEPGESKSGAIGVRIFILIWWKRCRYEI